MYKYKTRMNINQLKLLGLAYFGASSLLGFKRGIQNYNYEHNKLVKKYPNQKDSYLYTRAVLDGAFGAVFYVFPVTNLFMLPKEIYRLEVNLRNLEDEKKSNYYNSLM